MQVLITDWALESYLKLLHEKVFSKQDFQSRIGPDVMLLKTKYPQDEKFTISKFWGPATANSQTLEHGFKMKWHNIGDGKVQLRLAVAIIQKKAVLCQGYVKLTRKQIKEKC